MLYLLPSVYVLPSMTIHTLLALQQYLYKSNTSLSLILGFAPLGIALRAKNSGHEADDCSISYFLLAALHFRLTGRIL
jgi:hypothetical protein